MKEPFLPGQRWISRTEPDLGLGTVRQATDRSVTVHFGAAGETRTYASDQAPLRRVEYQAGDTVRDREDRSLVVEAVARRAGLLVYRGGGRELAEADLGDRLAFSDPLQRLLAGDLEEPGAFALRVAALEWQHRRRKSPARGFAGGRVELLPHQLHIASEVAGRLAPRVLLADEVGLGKTIEACLILHRLLLTGRAARVLILLPDSLVHQWFLELYRRFNLWFHIYDEDRCRALEAGGANPFLDDQLVLCGLGLLAGSPERARQALEAGWDLLVVDEAHHLEGAAYALVEALGAAVPSLLLLTATPEQLGVPGHFARLRLLDPHRFPDLDAYLRQADDYRAIADLAAGLLAPEPLPPPQAAALAALLGPDLGARLEESRPEALNALLDRHGTGRAMFRNTRAAVAGFPARIVHLAPLEPSPRDPRLDWLADLLRSTGDKVLLICSTRAQAEAIAQGLKPRVRVKAAVFHEGLTLVQRDRNAAWFAEPGGARILLCSEIGSEGRNFQFAHHLVLYDLPLDPDVLEQRIGRLDRIGQARDVEIHVPYPRGGAHEVLARWYHEGLDAFRTHLHGGRELLERFRDRLAAPGDVEGLVEATRAAREELRARLERGRDRLLELNSFRPGASAALLDELRRLDGDRALEGFLLTLFDRLPVDVEEVGPRTYQLGSMGVLAEALPGLSADGLTVTFDRERALAREELQFLTWDHPLVSGALDLLLGGGGGTSCFGRWPDPKASALYLEAVYVLACAAPPQLHVDRFLPPTPLRVVVDAQGRDLTAALPRALLARSARPAAGQGLLARPEVRQELLPRMLARAGGLAEARAPRLLAKARQDLAAHLDREIERLRALRRVNGGVSEGDIEGLLHQKAALDTHLREARLRLDAIHLVHRG
ncbi:helicase-related protein [Mesoterricola silvestris]|uniref:RNA polymerase-associated protein RapA n=1 Tax=Mesoterricola silvestris TaxID=2927979 RepID=A0AA48K794_9BACT|nr:helicase-related protein [Mesoterricola silvestris]BDU71614.1 RNA polymerase-associated protein RapA [Mesoterricola silvestris]